MTRRSGLGNQLRASLIRANACCFGDRYKISSNSLVGEGSFGRVHRCTDKLTRATRAVKKITIPPDEQQQAHLIGEINALVALDHPHIVRLIEYFRENGELLLVMELLEGPTLGHEMHRLGVFVEPLVARCIRHILKALFCCHCCNIAHNDVSADNFQFETCSHSSCLRMVDLGLSHDCQSHESQVHRNMKRDVWAAGVIFFRMLTGTDLFPKVLSSSGKSHFEPTNATDLSYVPSRLQSLHRSIDARDLLQGMLGHSAAERLTAREALRHPFITNFYVEDPKLLRERCAHFTLSRCLDAFRRFHDTSKLMRLALLVVAHLLTNNNDVVNSIHWLFRYLLQDGQRVEENMMRERMLESGIEVPDDFSIIFRSADQAGNGGITYVEFVAAAIIDEPRVFCSDHMLRAVFRFLCTEDVDSISDGTLQLVFCLPASAEQGIVYAACGSASMNYESFKTVIVPEGWDETATEAAWADWADTPSLPRDPWSEIEEVLCQNDPPLEVPYNPVKSIPSIAFMVCQMPGFYSNVLKPFYESQRVSNVVLGVVSGTSSFAVTCARLGYAEIVDIRSDLGAFFLMLNPKYHVDPCDVDLSTDPKLRLVGWWIHPIFVPELKAWYCAADNTIVQRNETSLGNPGDFGFSDRMKPSGYLNTYRDLAGQEHLEMLSTLAAGTGNFLRRLLGGTLPSARPSVGFHYPVRSQYSTLHLQVRVNSGNVCGGSENRAVDFFQLQSRLEADVDALSRDDETLHFEATSNLHSTLLAAAEFKGVVVEEVGPESLILH